MTESISILRLRVKLKSQSNKCIKSQNQLDFFRIKQKSFMTITPEFIACCRAKFSSFEKHSLRTKKLNLVQGAVF